MTTLHQLLSPDEDARIMMRWWWVGPTITPEEIERELALMKAAGIGGVEVAFLYPVTLETEQPASYPFLSETFLAALRHAAISARAHAMTFDITLGSGWPYGGPHITGSHQARKLRIVEITVAAGAVNDAIATAHGDAELLAATLNGETLEINKERLTLAPSNESGTLRLLLSEPTGQAVKRAAIGAEGFALDHYSEEALAAHLDAVGEPLIQAVGAHCRAIFCDSLEVYHSNWTPNFLAEFKRLRGYDLTPHLPQLLQALQIDQAGEVSQRGTPSRSVADLQHDYALTLQDLLEQKFLAPLKRFAHANGVASRVQVYGVPPTSLSSYQFVDIPEGETTLGNSPICLPADWTEITPLRFASSAGKHYGKGLISGETWTRLHSPPYAATPLDMKAEADRFFLQGVNQIIGHGWCQKPENADPSQWVFYAAGNFNEANPWHPVLPDLARYLQFVCSLMRQGKPVADVAIYLPDHDVMSARTFSTSKENLNHVKALREHIGTDLPSALLARGYNFDLIDDRIITGTSDLGNYSIIILPHITQIPLETLNALTRYCKNGGHLVALGRIPERAPGFLQQAESDEVAQRCQALFSAKGPRSAHCASSVEELMRDSLPHPDVALNQDIPAIGYSHRRMDEGDVYLFVNTSNEPVMLTPSFKDSDGQFTWMRPLDGQLFQAGLESSIPLEPFESVITVRTLARDKDGEPRSPQKPTPAIRECLIEQPWTLNVPDRNIAIELEALKPWTDFNELADYSGEVEYRCTFDCEQELSSGLAAFLEFEKPVAVQPYRFRPERRNIGFSVFLKTPVMDAARLWLNGQYLGSLFAPPYRIDATSALQPGVNTLSIKVSNRLINQLGNTQLYDFEKVHQVYGKRIEDIHDFENLSPAPSGLAGKLKLTFSPKCQILPR